jgi:hypothetical protein
MIQLCVIIAVCNTDTVCRYTQHMRVPDESYFQSLIKVR